MSAIHIRPKVPREEKIWPEWRIPSGGFLHHTGDLHVAGLVGGMQSGKPSVMIRVDLEQVPKVSVLIELSLANFLIAAKALEGAHGDPTGDALMVLPDPALGPDEPVRLATYPQGKLCEKCGHRHSGEALGFICVGCPCEERPR